MKKRSHGEMGFISFLCCLAYSVSYLARLNYAASLVEIQRALAISKGQAGLPVTGSFLAYGVGQLACGYLGDKVSPRKVIFGGLLGTAGCNLLVALFPRIEAITVVWCINGFFQSMLWPPLVRIMAESLDEAWYRKCSVLVSLSSSLGTVAVYIFVPVCFGNWGWQAAFLVPALLGAGVAFYWGYHTKALGICTAGQGQGGSRAGGRKVPPLRELLQEVPILPILLAIVLMGALRDGITTWMPAYLMDNFGTDTQSSVLMTAVIPVFSIFSTLLASLLYYRLHNELFTAAWLFGGSLLACICLLLAHGSYAAACIALMMLATGCMYGINLMLISHLPKYFAGLGMAATISGLLNAFTYVGSSLSAYCFGRVAEKSGWNGVIGIWLAFSAAGAVALFGSMGKWRKFSEKID